MISFAPIAIFAYKRKDKIEQCLSSLKKCDGFDKSQLFIFSDGFKGEADKGQVGEVRDYLRTFSQMCSCKSIEIIESKYNKGLANSIITGVTSIVNKYGKIIVVEDDLIVSKDFIKYMNIGLDFYETNKRYGMISAYTYPLKELDSYDKDVYVTRKGDCWGWATWKDRWETVDWELKNFDEYLSNKKERKAFSSLEYGLEEQLISQHNGKLDAWAARWIFHLFQHNYLTVYPKICRAVNMGNDSSGENCSTDDKYSNILYQGNEACRFEYLDVDHKLETEIYCFSLPSMGQRIIANLRRFYSYLGISGN